jgi:hypothetical protein
LTPVDVWRHNARDGEHIGTNVDSNHMSRITQPLPGDPRNDSGSARDIQKTIALRQLYFVEREFGPRPK